MSERLCIFIDGDFLLHAVRKQGVHVRYDFKALKNWLSNQRVVGHIRFYCREFGDGARRAAFYDVLRRAGIEVVPVCSNSDFFRQRLVAKMAWDLCEQTQGCTTLILVTAGGFSSLLPNIRHRGMQLEVVSLPGVCSEELQRGADRFRILRLNGLNMRRRCVRDSTITKDLSHVEQGVV